ncbi:unnamed protein product [Lactuca virosa]|uniref:Sulfite reductase [NADPH] flavoprotein alpha-component-like FAD-binding domain-containing protein n=1 Tax=Lactuca virosa TaxID=75947 RepID=A0AAU9NR33_9ASTR|nr:unnamed protein product [Lactuca virosa]
MSLRLHRSHLTSDGTPQDLRRSTEVNGTMRRLSVHTLTEIMKRPPLPPLRKYLIHITCQASAYVVGVDRWATALKLGSDSVGIEYNTHRNIRIALLALGTIQEMKKKLILFKGKGYDEGIFLCDFDCYRAIVLTPRLTMVFDGTEVHVVMLMLSNFQSAQCSLLQRSLTKDLQISGELQFLKEVSVNVVCKKVKNQPITRASYDKDVRHLEFEPLSSTIEYEVGNVLEILPSQSPEAIDAFMTRCNLNPESYIIVKPRNKEDSFKDGVGASKDPIKLKTFVELTMDIASASPRRYFFEVMSFFVSAEHEKERLEYFASPQGRDDLKLAKLTKLNRSKLETILPVTAMIVHVKTTPTTGVGYQRTTMEGS